MGDTATGSWGSRELGGYIRREEARAMATKTRTLWSWEEHCPPHSADSQVRLMARTVRGAKVVDVRVVAVLDSDNPEQDRRDAEAIVTAMNEPKLSDRERDTIIAALRMWQADVTDGMTKTEGIPADFANIALEHGDALTSKEIDALIPKL